MAFDAQLPTACDARTLPGVSSLERLGILCRSMTPGERLLAVSTGYPDWQQGQKCEDRPPITIRSIVVWQRWQALPPRP